ncbi:vWA domain-containing protein [Persicimonas caeni]|nr:VWA domain-containing protein [Persicimonas caeni]
MKRTVMMALMLVAILGLATSASAKQAAKPAPKASAGGTLDLEAALSHGYVPAKADKTIHARIQVRADDAKAKERAPMNLAVVIDHSGSMAGGRLDQAKQAAHTLVDRLGESDRLAVVSYGNHVTTNMNSVFVTEANKEKLHAAISSIRLRGSTNLAGGFEKGASIVGEHPTDDSINRVVLLSDGHANIGAKTPHALGKLASKYLEKGVSVSTMGIGLDYNEKLMAEMAKQGAGNYYFVEDEKKLAKIFAQEFETLSQVVARDAKLVLDIGAGVELLDLHGFPYTNKRGKVTVKLGDFYARQHKDIMLDLSVSPRGEVRRDVVTARLEFADVTKSNKRVHSKATLAAVGSDDQKQLAQVDKSVMRRVEQINYAKSVAKATDAYEKGDRKEAEKILADQQKRLKDAQNSYEFDADKVSEKVAELEEQKKEMKRSRSSSSKSGKRLKKSSRKKMLDVMQSAEAF